VSHYIIWSIGDWGLGNGKRLIKALHLFPSRSKNTYTEALGELGKLGELGELGEREIGNLLPGRE